MAGLEPGGMRTSGYLLAFTATAALFGIPREHVEHAMRVGNLFSAMVTQSTQAHPPSPPGSEAGTLATPQRTVQTAALAQLAPLFEAMHLDSCQCHAIFCTNCWTSLETLTALVLLLLIPGVCVVASIVLQAISISRMPTVLAQQQLACIQAVLYRSQHSFAAVVAMVQARLHGDEAQARNFVLNFQLVFDKHTVQTRTTTDTQFLNPNHHQPQHAIDPR